MVQEHYLALKGEQVTLTTTLHGLTPAQLSLSSCGSTWLNIVERDVPVSTGHVEAQPEQIHCWGRGRAGELNQHKKGSNARPYHELSCSDERTVLV